MSYFVSFRSEILVRVRSWRFTLIYWYKLSDCSLLLGVFYVKFFSLSPNLYKYFSPAICSSILLVYFFLFLDDYCLTNNFYVFAEFIEGIFDNRDSLSTARKFLFAALFSVSLLEILSLFSYESPFSLDLMAVFRYNEIGTSISSNKFSFLSFIWASDTYELLILLSLNSL